ncbi:MAG: hypothetical protein AAFW81_04945 [Pseudomonadota bacterium]
MKNAATSKVWTWRLLVIGYVIGFQPANAESERCEKVTAVNGAELDFHDLENIVEACDVYTIDEFLAVLPEDFRSRYSLVYDSRSNQAASVKAPRALVFNSDASLVIAFNGEKHQPGYHTIEMMQFTDDAEFQFQRIYFPADLAPDNAARDENLKPYFSMLNPLECASCHRSNQRPIWDTYSLWPGVFGSNYDNKPTYEAHFYDQFVEEMKAGKPRYRQLTDPEKFPIVSEYYDYYTQFPNFQFTLLLGRLNAIANAKELGAQEELFPFRYALLYALSCNEYDYPKHLQEDLVEFGDRESLAQLIPLSVSERFAKTHQSIFEDMYEKRRMTYAMRENRSCELQRDLYYQSKPDFKEPFQCGKNYVRGEFIEPTANVRYVVENLGYDMRHWSMEMGSSNHAFFLGPHPALGGVDVHYWKAVLDKDSDPYLYKVFKKAFDARNDTDAEVFFVGRDGRGAGYRENVDGELIFSDVEFPKVCSALKAKSLDALSEYAGE